MHSGSAQSTSKLVRGVEKNNIKVIKNFANFGRKINLFSPTFPFSIIMIMNLSYLQLGLGVGHLLLAKVLVQLQDICSPLRRHRGVAAGVDVGGGDGEREGLGGHLVLELVPLLLQLQDPEFEELGLVPEKLIDNNGEA